MRSTRTFYCLLALALATAGMEEEVGTAGTAQ